MNGKLAHVRLGAFGVGKRTLSMLNAFDTRGSTVLHLESVTSPARSVRATSDGRENIERLRAAVAG